MSNTTATCIYPLVNTIHSPYFEATSCGISCGSKDFFIFYTRDEEERLKTILFVMSLITICFVPVYFCTVLLQKRQSQRSFFRLRFAYQCPFFISSGYILVACITMSPFMFGADKIICNEDEKTLTNDSLHNIPCLFTALGIFVAIRLVVFYATALSISLVLTLYFPSFVQLKCYFHIPIFAGIVVGVIRITSANSISGDYYLGFCTTSLTSRGHQLSQYIIPLGSCVFIFFICLLMASVKLFRQNMQLVNAFSVNRDMQSLFKRLLFYNVLQTTAVVALVGNFVYWYVNSWSWRQRAYSTIICEIGKTLANQTLSEDYEMCVRENEDLSKPQIWTYLCFLLCGVISLLGAIIFQCSLKVQRRSLSSFRDDFSSFVERVRSLSQQRSSQFVDKSQSKEQFSSVTEVSQAVRSMDNTTILETLHSDSSCVDINHHEVIEMSILSNLGSESSVSEQFEQ